MKKFLTSNSTKYRLLRTILQGVVGAIVSYIDVIIGYAAIPDELRPFIVALVMAILSPIMSELGASIEIREATDTEEENAEPEENIFDYLGEVKDNENENKETE